MSEHVWAALALVWVVGMVVSFRLEAKHLIKKKNKRRSQAIEAAAVTAPWWPFLVVGLLVAGGLWLVKTVLLAGIPESQADRDARTKELERELEVPLEEALKAATATEELPPDTTLGDVLAAAHKDKEKLPEGFFQTRCARCGCDVVRGRVGYVHVPSLGIKWTPCSNAEGPPEEALEYGYRNALRRKVRQEADDIAREALEMESRSRRRRRGRP